MRQIHIICATSGPTNLCIQENTTLTFNLIVHISESNEDSLLVRRGVRGGAALQREINASRPPPAALICIGF